MKGAVTKAPPPRRKRNSPMAPASMASFLTEVIEQFLSHRKSRSGTLASNGLYLLQRGLPFLAHLMDRRHSLAVNLTDDSRPFPLHKLERVSLHVFKTAPVASTRSMLTAERARVI